jgi:multiple sugar transport system substrate-binding protein
MKHSHYLFVVPVVLALVVLMGLLLLLPTSTRAATSGTAASPASAVTITYWHPQTGSREASLNRLIDEFNATNPYSITVVGEYAGTYGQIYDRVIDGLRNDGVLPNVVVAYPNGFADFARYGKVRFLDAYFDDPAVGISDPADFYPGVLDYYRLGEYGNQLVGLQNGISIEVMYYNAGLLDGVGLPVPTTWDEFETACISVTSETVSGTIPGLDTSRFATWLWSRGGELLSGDLNHARFDEQPGIDSLALFQNLIRDGYARLSRGSYEDQTAFGNGQVGFTFGSSVGIPYYRDAMDQGANDAWGVTHTPAVAGHAVVDAYGGGHGILHHSEAQDRAAWLFIKWLVDSDQTARWAAVSGYFPVRISAADHVSVTEKLADDPQYAQALGLLPLGRNEPGIRGYEAIRAIIKGAMTDVLEDGAGVAETLHAAADEVDAILAASAPDSAVIPPTGGTLTYTGTQGISATVQFPAGALTETETVSYVPLDDLPTDGLAFALAPNLTFDRPVTLTIHYRDEDVAGMDENALRLYTYDWSINSWVDADPCGGYVRWPDENLLQAFVCHFSDYGMMQFAFRIHLPLIVK